MSDKIKIVLYYLTSVLLFLVLYEVFYLLGSKNILFLAMLLITFLEIIDKGLKSKADNYRPVLVYTALMLYVFYLIMVSFLNIENQMILFFIFILLIILIKEYQIISKFKSIFKIIIISYILFFLFFILSFCFQEDFLRILYKHSYYNLNEQYSNFLIFAVCLSSLPLWLKNIYILYKNPFTNFS